MKPVLHTVGHSTHPLERFLALLERHEITAIADVRSSPYSRYNPHFNRESLHRALIQRRIAYVFLGEELGARSKDASCYNGGRVQYDLLARTTLFQKGLERVQDGAAKFRVSLLCAEGDPATCHRTILICRYLPEFEIRHILADGSVTSHSDVEQRLLRLNGLSDADLFESESVRLAKAYKLQEERIAYVQDES